MGQAAVAPEGIADHGFRVQDAAPLAVLLHPCRGVGCFEVQRLAVDDQILRNPIADDRDVRRRKLDLHIAEPELLQRPLALPHHRGERFVVDRRGALRSGDDRFPGHHPRRRGDVLVDHGLPEAGFEIDDLLFVGHGAFPCLSGQQRPNAVSSSGPARRGSRAPLMNSVTKAIRRARRCETTRSKSPGEGICVIIAYGQAGLSCRSARSPCRRLRITAWPCSTSKRPSR